MTLATKANSVEFEILDHAKAGTDEIQTLNKKISEIKQQIEEEKNKDPEIGFSNIFQTNSNGQLLPSPLIFNIL